MSEKHVRVKSVSVALLRSWSFNIVVDVAVVGALDVVVIRSSFSQKIYVSRDVEQQTI